MSYIFIERDVRMNKMYEYLKEHAYISYNKKSTYEFELSSERAECIANKYENLINDLQQENKKLRQQLYELGGVDEYNRHLINKQQQFIKYLEDEIKGLKGSDIYYYSLQRMALVTHEHILRRYKEIMEIPNEENK